MYFITNYNSTTFVPPKDFPLHLYLLLLNNNTVSYKYKITTCMCRLHMIIFVRVVAFPFAIIIITENIKNLDLLFHSIQQSYSCACTFV